MSFVSNDNPSYAQEALEDAEKRKLEKRIKDFQQKTQERLDKEDVSSHYEGKVEPIELMVAQFNPDAYMGFLRGNIIKYASRFGKKDTKLCEAKKIFEYAKYLLCYVENLDKTSKSQGETL